VSSAEALHNHPLLAWQRFRRTWALDEANLSAPSAEPIKSAAAVDMGADVVLVKQYLAGDAHAFELLFRKYETPVFNFISRMVSGEDAYDLTQDVFCCVLRSLHTFRGDSKFSTWLYSIARNICLNRLRRRACVRVDSLDQMCENQPGFDLPSDSPDADRVLETHELQRIINDILSEMNPEQRMIITLRDFEQLSYEEISSIMGLSLANTKSKLHRARMAFKQRFKPYINLWMEGRE